MGDTQQVISVGNSWILCKSKSQPGRPYYFNTLTGEAVWNLTDAEIEKSKKSSKDPISKEIIENCPEPTYPPNDSHENPWQGQNICNKRINNNTYLKTTCSCVPISKEIIENFSKEQPSYDNKLLAQNSYNKQIINNTHPKPSCSCHSQFVTTQCLRCDPVGTLHQMSLSVRTMPQYNANEWALPPHKVLMTPNVSSNVSQVQTSNNCLYNSESNFLSQNPSPHVLNLIGVSHNNASNAFLKQDNRFTNISKGAKFGHEFQNDNKIYDLRQLLSAKRKHAYNKLTSSQSKDLKELENATSDKLFKYNIDGQHKNSPGDVSETRETSGVDISSRNVDEEWLEQNTCVQGTKLTLDVTCLKQLATSSANSDIWYIVTDATVLLNNLMFLYSLVSADDHCRLMVPKQAMNELDEIVLNDVQHLNNRAQRARCLIDHYIRAGLAIMGKELCDKSDEQILSNCLELVKENYHVILLSNDTKLQNHKYSSLVPTFTVKNLQKFLATKTKTIENCRPLERLIKITIPNDMNQKGAWKHDTEPNKITCDSNVGTEVLLNDIQVSQYEEVDNQTDITTSKPIVDAQVQTDLRFSELEDIFISNSELPQDSNILNDNTNSGINVTNLHESQSSTKFDPNYSRREIRLKRNNFNQLCTNTSSGDVAERKQFKWRRRRSVSNVQVSSDNVIDSNTILNIHPQSEGTTNDVCFSNELRENDESCANTPSDNVAEKKQFKWGRKVSMSNVQTLKLTVSSDHVTDSSTILNVRPQSELTSTDVCSSSKVDELCTSTSSHNVAEKKQFKWRRKGTMSNVETLKLATANSSDNVTDSNTILNIHQSEVTSNDSCFKSNDTIKSDNLVICNTDHSVNNHNKPKCYEEDKVENNSEASVPRKINENIIIEETSTSGIISNTTSNIDSESIHSIGHSHTYTNSQRNYAIFKVNDSIAEHLTMKSDEWVSRFTQIMEEVLTQVLHLAPAFEDPKMLPPWTIHEASQCIIKKYNQHFEIIKTANKLSDILYKVSDIKGKIRIKLSPSEHMAMYTYGKDLVDALQTVLSNCDDLQAAAESLSKLLSDIENPNLNSSSNIDSFVDAAEPSARISEPTPSSLQIIKRSTKIQNTENESNMGKQDTTCDINRAPTKYSFRSPVKYLDKEKADQPVCFIGEMKENTFFKCLDLQKKSAEDNNVQIVQDNTCLSNIPDISSVVNSSELDNLQSKETAADKNNESNIEPKIIRKFNICVEYEERLKNKQRSPLDLDELNYSVYDEEEECMEECYPENSIFFDDDIEDETIEENDNIEPDESEYIGPECFKEDVIRHDFKLFAKSFFNETRDTFLEVHAHCQKCHQDLSHSEQLTSNKKHEILDKTQKAQLCMISLCKSLNSVLGRDIKSTKALLKGIDVDYGQNDSQITEYREFVTKSIDQANHMLEILSLIINTVKN